jgi:hypothetical protein
MPIPSVSISEREEIDHRLFSDLPVFFHSPEYPTVLIEFLIIGSGLVL